MKKYIISGLLATSLSYGSSDFHININNDTLEIGTDILLNNYYKLNNNSSYYITMSHLKTEAYENEPDQSLDTLGIKVFNNISNRYNIQLGLGIKTVYTNQLDKRFSAIPLSFYITYNINPYLFVNMDISYAPRVLSYYDAENFSDARCELNYKVIDNGYIYIGARDITTKYTDTGDVEYDKAAYIGYKIRF